MIALVGNSSINSLMYFIETGKTLIFNTIADLPEKIA